MQRCGQGAPDYPKRLDGLGSSAPAQIFFRGPAWSPEPRAVGVVGSRRASEAGRAWAHALGARLAGAQVAVVSGGALGIDGAAHEGALLGRGRTCVVLPTPVDDPSPRTHVSLFAAILAAGGTLLSEYEGPLGRHTFAARNRIIAALSDLVVVVEARARSGTRYTAEAARALERPLLIKRWPPGDLRGEGSRAFLALGAVPVDEPEEVLAHLDAPASSSPPVGSFPRAPRATSGVDGLVSLQAVDPDPVFDALASPRTLEDLDGLLGVAPAELARRLLELELEGRAERVAGRWRRVGP